MSDAGTVTGRILRRVSGLLRAGEARTAKAFDGVESYCMFIGYPRSGHSLVGSLLDAHPNAVIAHELDALQRVQEGITREELYRLLVRNSRGFTDSGREWNGYSYEVPGQWQGRFERLAVIGDKKGGASSKRLSADATLLDRLERTVGARPKLVHVVRNPYDNIGAMFRERAPSRSLEDIVRWYLLLCETNAGIKARVGEDSVFDLRHEELVEHPRRVLSELCRFLGLRPGDDYLESCAGVVFSSLRRSRHDVPWNPASVAAVRRATETYDFLDGYSYDE